MRTIFIPLTVFAITGCTAGPAGSTAATMPARTPPPAIATPHAGPPIASGSTAVEPTPTLQPAVDACADLFSGPQYDVPWAPSPTPRGGRPATLEGAAQTLCAQSGSCHVRTFLPAGSDPDTGEAWFISRVDHDPLPLDPAQCPSIDYFLVVAREGKITRTTYLIETGNSCMHWRDEQITVGNGLFTWRDSGFGSPISDYEAWGRQSTLQLDLATLRVNGCKPPTIEPTVPILRRRR